MISVFKPIKDAFADPVSIETLTRDVNPKPIHSHNDYWRKRPCLDALAVGCTSIEADVWKFSHEYVVTDTVTRTTAKFSDSEVYVGHNQVHLKPEDTLQNLYLKPLQKLLTSANKRYDPPMEVGNTKHGVFWNSPETTLNLWLDIKTDAVETYRVLQRLTQPFADMGLLSYYDPETQLVVEGPLAITLTGNVPWEELRAETAAGHRRNFFADCPLHGDVEKSAENGMCLFASASLEQILGSLSNAVKGKFTAAENEALGDSAQRARAAGLKTRVWGTVEWPVHVREMHWRAYRNYMDLLNTDDINAAAAF